MKEKNWLDMYSNAANYMRCGQISKAIDMLEKLVTDSKDTSNKNVSAAYVTLCSCYEMSCIKKKDFLRIGMTCEKYAKKSLELNPQNKVAPFTLVRALVLQENYIEACEVIAKYDLNLSMPKDGLASSDAFHKMNLEFYKFFHMALGKAIMERSVNNPDFVDALIDIYYKYDCSINYAMLIINPVIASGLYAEAVKLIYDCLKEDNSKNMKADAKVALASQSVYCHSCFADNREIRRSINKLDSYIALYGTEISDSTKYSVMVNKSLGYSKLCDITQVDILWREIPEEYKDNSILYNLAKAYFDSGNYDEALRLGWSAVQTKHDDNDFLLLGRVYMGMGQYESAISMFKKAIGFIVADKEMPYSNYYGEKVTSISDRSTKDRLNDIYKNLIQAYVCNEQYDYAEAILEKIKENGQKPSVLLESELLIRIEKNISKNTDDIKKAYESLNKELKVKTQENSMLKRNMSDWYTKLTMVQLVNSSEEISDQMWDDEFCNHMNDVLDRVVSYCVTLRNREYQAVVDKINQRFPKLNKVTRNFLATAEQIYLTFEKEDMMDFAPVMVEYARFIETLLWTYINASSEYTDEATKNKKYNNQGETLGAATRTISLKGGSLEKYYEKVEWIRKNRNRSAHINVSREPEVTAIRNYIWNSDIIDVLTSI